MVTSFFFAYKPRKQTPESYQSSVFNSLGIFTPCFGSAKLCSYEQYKQVLFLPYSGQQLLPVVFCDNSHPNRSEVLFLCGFNLHFSHDLNGSLARILGNGRRVIVDNRIRHGVHFIFLTAQRSDFFF